MMFSSSDQEDLNMIKYLQLHCLDCDHEWKLKYNWEIDKCPECESDNLDCDTKEIWSNDDHYRACRP